MMATRDEEDALLRSAALQNARSILVARQRADREAAQAKEALRESTERLQLALAAGRLGDWSWEAATDRLTLGPRAAEIFGVPAGERFTGAGMRALLHPDDAGLAAGDMTRALAHGTDYNVEYRVRHSTRGERWIAARGVATYASDGSVASVIGVVQDITERKAADTALRETQTRLTMAIEAGQMGDWEWIVGSGKVRWSAALEAIHGLPAGAFGGTFGDFQRDIHPEDRARVVATIQASLERRSGYRVEYRIIKPDGVTAWIEARGKLFLDAHGAPERMAGVCMDVTPRKLAEEKLHDETRILELLNRTGAILTSNLDLQTLLQSATDAATQLSGAGYGAFSCHRIDDAGNPCPLYTLSGVPPAAHAEFGQPRGTSIFGPPFLGSVPIRSDDVQSDPRFDDWTEGRGMLPGDLAIRSYLGVPVVMRNGEVIGGLFLGHPDAAVFTERTERIITGIAAQAAVAIDNARLYEAARGAAEERRRLLANERTARADAERANSMKDDFLATLSHELRTPLNSILGWSQVLKLRVATPDVQRGLDSIERNARVQAQLIEDLLDMSRITSGKVRLDIQPVEPVPVIEAAIETVRHAAEAKGIRIEKFFDPAVGPIPADPSRLQQVMWNLLSNAIKFTAKEGTVRVALERVESHIEISVADTGIGIERAFLPYVFERFRQADASTTRTYSGLGLGLSIVKHLVELHGGTVRAKSDGEGRGATFSVHLPLPAVQSHGRDVERPHPRPARSAVGEFKHSDLTGLKVLVIDDEPDARELVRHVLAECNATVFVAAHAEEALAMVEAQRPDVLVSDIGMPDVDGYELLHRIRALGAGAGGNVPAIALTAFARSQDRTRALRAGFLVHVAKPVEPSELVATVATVAGRTGK